MNKILTFFDTLFEHIFSDKNQKKIERVTLWLSIIGFITHLLLIFSKRFELFHTPFEARLLDDPISAIYTPFSIILVYEIYLLIMYLPRSFTTAVSKQFEIISLILIRRIFGDIPKIELDVNWIENTANRQLIYDLIGVLILYFLIYQFNKHQNKITKKELSISLKRFVSSKRAVSLILLPVLIFTSIYTAFTWISGLFSASMKESVLPDINSVFYNEFFTILILADVFILLLSFQYTERYSQLIRNTGFVICTILIRLSFGTYGLTNILLIISSVLFGLLILRIYHKMESDLLQNS
ncbi:hypothetical protein N9848_01840 [Flavobacteriaceae bacterium]|mgnify:FL=1|jgi:hypothetical protein|nr:hypothetical protein [Flavobacteriaceae bacterium]MDB4063334.1 hypothetical protein [Flavobacteriaceae bacterium]MDB4235441.1 hypothetical protein [bacterium]MDB4255366.1 hypothetical protein [Flavobacteriaceae bacterium]MDC1392101.1 hypothetical protein [Flavobacteriaceae bacterium]